MTNSRASRWILSVAAVAALAAGCKGPPPKPRTVDPVVRDVPEVLRGTIGSEASLVGIEPVLVNGYGLVVGLRGTGGQPLPQPVQATMERELGLRGIGKGADQYFGTGLDGLSPAQLLRRPEVAVVEVWAAIPPGAPQGSGFDVWVNAINASSLEGGTLWTTELRLASGFTPSVFGQVQTQKLAEAGGPIFINPYADPTAEDAITRVSGRVLRGGRVTSPFKLELVLDNASHLRARAVTQTIQSRFPEGEGDRGPVARGKSDSSVTLVVPRRFADRPADFVRMIEFLQVDSTMPEEYAKRYVEGVEKEPYLAEELSWAMAALGPRAIPIIRGLYGSAEQAPRLAGLRAGARLGDPQVAGPLRQMVQNTRGIDRLDAISLLGEIDAGPTVEATLRPLLGEPELTVRVSAYEALARRAERAMLSGLIARELSASQRDRKPLSHLEMLAGMQFPGDTIQGVERRALGGKFLLDLVPAGDPLIYIAQQGRPRVVLFGAAFNIQRPSLASAWSDRLMVSAESEGPVRVYYRDANGRVTVAEVGDSVADLVELFAREPEPGSSKPAFGMSYSEVVGALSALQKEGAIAAGFATETDRLRAQLLAADKGSERRERPETTKDSVVVLRGFEQKAVEAPGQSKPNKPRIVPIEPKPKK